MIVTKFSCFVNPSDTLVDMRDVVDKLYKVSGLSGLSRLSGLFRLFGLFRLSGLFRLFSLCEKQVHASKSQGVKNQRTEDGSQRTEISENQISSHYTGPCVTL